MCTQTSNATATWASSHAESAQPAYLTFGGNIILSPDSAHKNTLALQLQAVSPYKTRMPLTAPL